jgi:hypothetical protein
VVAGKFDNTGEIHAGFPSGWRARERPVQTVSMLQNTSRIMPIRRRVRESLTR